LLRDVDRADISSTLSNWPAKEKPLLHNVHRHVYRLPLLD
jgi:hypothetical protein